MFRIVLSQAINVITPYKIKLIYVMNRRLNLPLYEMTNRAYEMVDSLRKVISSIL